LTPHHGIQDSQELSHTSRDRNLFLFASRNQLVILSFVESIVNAVAIYKTMRSQSPYRKQSKE